MTSLCTADVPEQEHIQPGEVRRTRAQTVQVLLGYVPADGRQGRVHGLSYAERCVAVVEKSWRECTIMNGWMFVGQCFILVVFNRLARVRPRDACTRTNSDFALTGRRLPRR